MNARRKGKPFWRMFWMGGAMERGTEDTSKGLLGTRLEKPAEATRDMTYLVTLWLSIAIGVWLSFTRISFGGSSATANSDHLTGALVITFSLMALAEFARALRLRNVSFGAWLIVVRGCSAESAHGWRRGMA